MKPPVLIYDPTDLQRFASRGLSGSARRRINLVNQRVKAFHQTIARHAAALGYRTVSRKHYNFEAGRAEVAICFERQTGSYREI